MTSAGKQRAGTRTQRLCNSSALRKITTWAHCQTHKVPEEQRKTNGSATIKTHRVLEERNRRSAEGRTEAVIIEVD